MRGISEAQRRADSVAWGIPEAQNHANIGAEILQKRLVDFRVDFAMNIAVNTAVKIAVNV